MNCKSFRNGVLRFCTSFKVAQLLHLTSLMKLTSVSGGHCQRIWAILSANSVCLTILGLSRAYQPHIGRSASLQDLTLVKVPCGLNIPTLWTITFRWVLAIILPLILILPIIMHLKLKLWTRCSFPLKCYIRFFASVVFTNFLFQIPSFILDVSRVQSLESLPQLILKNSTNMDDIDFCSRVLSEPTSKMQFAYFPIGAILFLPWKLAKEQRYDYVERSYLYRQIPKKCTVLPTKNAESETMLENS